MDVNTTRRQKQRAARKRVRRKPITGALLSQITRVDGSALLLLLLLLVLLGKREGQGARLESLLMPTDPLAFSAFPAGAAAAAAGSIVVVCVR